MKRLSEKIMGFCLNGLYLFTSILFIAFISSFAIRNDAFIIKNIVSDIDLVAENISNYAIGLKDIDNDLYDSEIEDFSDTFKIYDNLVQSIKIDENNHVNYSSGDKHGMKNIVTAGKYYQGNSLYLRLHTNCTNKFADFKDDTTSIFLDLPTAYQIYSAETIQQTEINNPSIYIDFDDQSPVISGNFTHFKYLENGSVDDENTDASYVLFNKTDSSRFYDGKWSGTVGGSSCSFIFDADDGDNSIGEGTCSYQISGKEVYSFRYMYDAFENSIKSLEKTKPEFSIDLYYGTSRKFKVKGYIGYGGDTNYECLSDVLGGNFFLVSDQVFPSVSLQKTYFLKCGNSSSWNETAFEYVIQHKLTTRMFVPGSSNVQLYIAEQFSPYSNYFNSKLSILVGIGLFVLCGLTLFIGYGMSIKGDFFIPLYKSKKFMFVVNFISNFIFFVLALLLLKRMNGSFVLNIYFVGINSISILISIILLFVLSTLEAFSKKDIREKQSKTQKEVKLDRGGSFDVPVCLMFFLRNDKLLKIIDVVRKVKPSKIYLLSDGPRNDDERIVIDKIRKEVEKAIDWKTKIVKLYHENNVGVCQNIGGGALKVFEKEETAIFLEDDNLPSESFFYYCRAMLNEYKNDGRILWINGTNYLGNSLNEKNAYYFTKHLLPCGWASWSDKFIKNYDIDLKTFVDKEKQMNFKNSYEDFPLFAQQYRSVENEYKRIASGEKASSWDYQMIFSLRSNKMYGIAPSVNLINNIGVDDLSIHGGVSNENIMTKRFCGIETNELEDVIYGSYDLNIDQEFEYRTGDIILLPFKQRAKNLIKRIIIKVFGQKFLDKLLSKKRSK